MPPRNIAASEEAASEDAGFAERCSLPLLTEQSLEARACEFFTTWGLVDRLAHVEVLFNPRLRSTAGRAMPKKLRIELNPALLAGVAERDADRVDEVLAHEAAHLATYLVHGAEVDEHGAEWQALMAAVDQPARVTHDFPLGDLGANYYLHLCGACGQRNILKTLRGASGCDCPADRTEVFRAPRTPAGKRELAAFRSG